MDHTNMVKLLLGILPATFVIILALILVFHYFSRSRKSKLDENVDDIEKNKHHHHPQQKNDETTTTTTATTQMEDLINFQNGGGGGGGGGGGEEEDLTIFDILDAPGEVIGKSSYGTLYKAAMERSNTVRLLRFVRPAACPGKTMEVESVIRVLGSIRHSNLVPLLAFYAGPRGEKLLVHPFYRCGSLAQLVKDGNGESHKWTVIYRISVGISRGLDHLHNGLQKPIIHGNLKSKNILLDRNYEPFVSDFGLHLLLNPTAGQEMLEASASQGYKAPELIKMRDASEETDIYSLGVILLELLSGKESINENPTPSQDFYLPSTMRNAILDHRIKDLFHPDVLLSKTRDGNPVTEERILKYFQLAMSCCSPSPSLRPNVKQIVRNLEEIGS